MTKCVLFFQLGILTKIIRSPKHGAIKISNLKKSTTAEQLGEQLENYGTIKLLNVLEDSNSKVCDGSNVKYGNIKEKCIIMKMQ